MDSKEKIQRTFVRDEAYAILRDRIVEGKLKPSEKLRDKELAEQLGVSRTPIREALLRLENEGLVQTKPNSTTVVSSIEFHDALHLYSIVWSLEQLALKQSFKLLTDKHIELMSKANERLYRSLKKNEPLSALEADNEFHSIYIKLSQNTELEQILTLIKQKLKRLEIYYFENIKNVFLSYEEHCQIIDTLKQKNLSAALKAIELNWKASLARLKP